MKKKNIEFKVNENGCFIVTSHQPNGEGYCYIRQNYRQIRAHRHIYQECFGEIKRGLVVRHKCDVRNCINPEHLELGTSKENTHDIISRGRWALGEKSGTNKITSEEARKIKILIRDGKRNYEIMNLLNVTNDIVGKIRRNKTWKHVAI